MSTRQPQLPWSALAVTPLMGCERGPSDQELCVDILAALPLVYVVTLAVLWLLELIRHAPDRGAGAPGRRALTTTGVLTAPPALAWLLGARPDPEYVAIVFASFGAVVLGVALAVWRGRSGAPYASRLLHAAQIGAGLGLPALFLWPLALDPFAHFYLQCLMVAAIAAFYLTPLLLFVLLIECFIHRARPVVQAEPDPNADP